MKIIFGLVIFSVGIISLVFGQKVGESEQAVRNAVGNPMAVRKTTDQGTIWMYSEGRRVVFEKGVVVSASDFSAVAAPTAFGTRSPAGNVDSTSHSSISEIHVAPVKKPDPVAEKNAARNRELKDQWVMFIVGAGAVVMTICGILILVEAFRASVLWGLLVLFIPIAQPIFVATHWSDTKKPFLVMVFIGVLCGLGALASAK